MARTLTDDKSRGMTDFTPRPTSYKGIKMRSRLEAGFAQWLDTRHVAWEYEPNAFASELGQYLPDFFLPGLQTIFGPVNAYVEIKPRRWGSMEEFLAIAERMIVIWESDIDAQLLIATPGQAVDHFQAITRVLPTKDGLQPGAMMWLILKDGLILCPPPMFVEDGPWHGEWWKG